MTYTQEPPFCIQVEPTEGCNLRCGFCGVRGIREHGEPGNLSGPYRYMALATARALGDQLAALGWNCRLELAMHGEPTRHPELPGLVRVLRRRLPKTPIMVTSNGLPWLDHPAGPHAYLDQLYAAGVNVVALDDYRPHRVAPLVRDYTGADVREYPADPDGNPHRRQPRGRRLLSIVADISQATSGTHSTLGNHAGAAGPPTDAAHGKVCAKPFREMAVRWDGSVAVCCNDWRGEYQVGNVVTDGLEAVWHHPRFYAARAYLGHGRRAELAPCAGCDHLSYRPGLLPDKKGQVALPDPTAEDARLVQEANGAGTYTPVVLRRWERP